MLHYELSPTEMAEAVEFARNHDTHNFDAGWDSAFKVARKALRHEGHPDAAAVLDQVHAKIKEFHETIGKAAAEK